MSEKDPTLPIPIIRTAQELSRVPEENRPLFTAVFALLALGLQRDEAYLKIISEAYDYDTDALLFMDLRSLRLQWQKNSSWFDPNLGIIRGDTILATQRDMWGKGILGPQIQVDQDRDTMATTIFICPGIEPSDLSYEVTKGIETVTLTNDGQVLGVPTHTITSKGSLPTRPLTLPEQQSLSLKLQGLHPAIQRLTTREEPITRYLPPPRWSVIEAFDQIRGPFTRNSLEFYSQ